MRHRLPLYRRLFCEFIGTMMLLISIVGAGNSATAQKAVPGLTTLLIAIAVGLMLLSMIHLFANVSGAHFNPAVTLTNLVFRRMSVGEAAAYIGVQLLGALLGVLLADLLFGRPILEISQANLSSGPHFLSELLGTVILLMIVFCLARSGNGDATPLSVAAYIVAVVISTPTAFLNPAVTVARIFTSAGTGDSAGTALTFVAAQLLAVVVVVPIILIVYPQVTDRDELAVKRLRRLATKV